MPDGLPQTPEGQRALMAQLLTMADGPIDQALMEAGVSQPRVVPQAPVTQEVVGQVAPAQESPQPESSPATAPPPDPMAVLAYQVQQLAEQNRMLVQHLQPKPPDPRQKLQEVVNAIQTEDGVSGERITQLLQTALQPIQEQNEMLLQRIARSEMPEDFRQKEAQIQAYLHQNPQVFAVMQTAWRAGDYKGALDYAHAMYSAQNPPAPPIDRRENVAHAGMVGQGAQAARAQSGVLPQTPQRVNEEGLKIAAKAWNSGDQRPVLDLLKTLLPDEPFAPVQTVWPIQ